MLNNLLKYLAVQPKPVRNVTPRKVGKVQTGSDWLSLAAPSGERNRTIFDPTGKPLHLKKSDLLAHGGEGFVYKLGINPHYLIKICKDDTLNNSRKQSAFCDRLNTMLALEDCRRADF